MSLIREIRSDPNRFRGIQEARFKDPAVVDRILELDQRAVAQDFLSSKYNQFKNLITKQVGQNKRDPTQFKQITQLTIQSDPTSGAMNVDTIFEIVVRHLRDGRSNDAVELLGRIDSDVLQDISRKIDREATQLMGPDFKGERDSLLNSLGNALHASVPVAKNEDHNAVVCVVDQKNKLSYDKRPDETQLLGHVELCGRLGIVDTDHGIRLMGNRGYFLCGLGVKLNMALMTYAMDFLERRGHRQMSVPHFLNQEVVEKLCQLQEFDETLYKVTDEESKTKYLIATSEQPLTGFYRDHKFKPGELPVKFAGLSTCYRKETGRHGVDTLGIFRVHQFEKVEQLCLTEADDSWACLEQMLQNARDFYDSLGISYRVVNIVSGALNNSASLKYDLEGYFAKSGTYKELVSCSNCTDYFSRKLNIKDRRGNWVHILNATLCANTRTLCAILEQWQTAEGVIIPPVLRPYMHDYPLTYLPFPMAPPRRSPAQETA